MSASTNWEDVYRTQTARIAELERETAAIKVQAERLGNANDRLVVENARLRMDLDADCNVQELRQMWAENAALREDKARLDWLDQHSISRLDLVMVHIEWNKISVREAIDAARKEAQP